MKNFKTGFVIAMVLLFTNSFGQSTGSAPGDISNDKKTAHTHLDLMVNIVSTNLNYGSANDAMADYKKASNGIQAGVSFQAGITSRFSLVSELYFIRKGGKLKMNNALTTNESKLYLNTLEMPVLVRIHAGKFYVNAGPSIAYNLSGKWKIKDESTKLSFDNSNESFKRLDAGIQLGGGVGFPLKQRQIIVDIRYNYGLTNISCGKEIYNRALISIHFSKAWKTNPLGKK